MHILLIEATLSGHHLIYLERTALAFLQDGNEITIAIPSGTKEIETLRSNLMWKKSIRWIEYKSTFELSSVGLRGLLVRECSARACFGQVYMETNKLSQVDYVFLPYIDYCLYAFGLLGSPFGVSFFGGISMRPAFHYKNYEVIAPSTKIDIIKRYIFLRLLKNRYLSKLLSIDELLIDYVTKKHPSATNKIGYLADPVAMPVDVNVANIRNNFNTPNNSKVILVYGSIDDRKGIELLLDTLEVEKSMIDWQVWLIGRQSKTVRELLASNRWSFLTKQARFQMLDEFVSAETEQQVFSACDVVWVVYRGHYAMSGVLVRAGVHGKPVIACCEGLIGWYTKTKKLGFIVDSTTESVISALSSINKLCGNEDYEKNGANCFEENTWQKFDKNIIGAIDD